MEIVKILLFVLGTYFGVNESHIVAEKTTITINDQEKAMHVSMKNLRAFVKDNRDSILVYDEWFRILENPLPIHDSIKVVSKHFTRKNDRLDASLRIEYNNLEDLKEFGFEIKEGKLNISNLQSYHLKTDIGKLVNENKFWEFNIKEKIEFTLEPFKSLPEKNLKEISAFFKTPIPYLESTKKSNVKKTWKTFTKKLADNRTVKAFVNDTILCYVCLNSDNSPDSVFVTQDEFLKYYYNTVFTKELISVLRTKNPKYIARIEAENYYCEVLITTIEPDNNFEGLQYDFTFKKIGTEWKLTQISTIP